MRLDGKKVRARREELDLSQLDVVVRARTLGHRLNLRTLSKIENEGGGSVLIDTAAAVATVLGCKLDDLVSETEHA